MVEQAGLLCTVAQYDDYWLVEIVGVELDFRGSGESEEGIVAKVSGDEELPATFLWRTMNCWGWATWSNRWDHFEKNAEKLVQDFSRRDVYEFNLFNSENFWGQVIANKKNKINTWAIFWYAVIFMNNGLCLNPSAQYVLNIGLDGSGEHCGSRDVFATKKIKNELLNPIWKYVKIRWL